MMGDKNDGVVGASLPTYVWGGNIGPQHMIHMGMHEFQEQGVFLSGILK